MKLKLAVVLILIAAGTIYANGTPQASGSRRAADSFQSFRAEQVVRALLEAYPRQIDRVAFRRGDWAVFLRGKWFYYAGGRLLPESELGNAANYNPMQFYHYPEELPPWTLPSPEEEEIFRAMIDNPDNSRSRANFFLNALWRSHERDESRQRLQTFHFLGNVIYVHYLIMENLALVEEQILEAAKSDPEIQEWIDSLSVTTAWSWRNIAETQSRSYHTYGIAVDLYPELGEKETYWLWAAERREDWWNVSYEERYHPPDVVIKAFEKYGFLWGGKWSIYDTMHFEYRPEVLLLNGLPPQTRR